MHRPSTKSCFREIGEANISNSYALAIWAYARRSFPTTITRWSLGGYLVGTWWSPLAAVPHCTISSLAIRQIVDRARTSERYIGPSPLSISSPSFIFFSSLSSLPLFLSFSSLGRWSAILFFSFCLSLSLSLFFFLLYMHRWFAN